MPPPPGTPVAVTVPNPVEVTLANGMRVVTVAKHDLPLVTATVVSESGGALDPVGRAGLASLTAGLMTKGTATRSATDIANQIESLGGTIAKSEEHTSELQSLMSISYAVFCLKKKHNNTNSI